MRTVSVIGGDLRQTALANFLKQDGFNVKIFGFDKDMDTYNLEQNKDIFDAVKADIVILPLPAENDGMINAPFSDLSVKTEDLLEKISKATILFGGKIASSRKELLKKRGIKIYDYFEREELSIANAVATAEGAIETAMTETPYTLHNTPCLVCGYGRIGKILSQRLKNFGADVTVSARKYSDFAWIDAFGMKSIHTDEFEKAADKFKIIFNTVPSVIFDSGVLEKIPKDTLIIDLASKPGGVDFRQAGQLGLNVIWALSIPGKCAPITSGKIIKNTIINMLEEMEEL